MQCSGSNKHVLQLYDDVKEGLASKKKMRSKATRAGSE